MRACAAKGLLLERVESLHESKDFVRLVTSSLWTGANDLQTPGACYWPSASSNSDFLFWSGGLGGSSPKLPTCGDLAPGDASLAPCES